MLLHSWLCGKANFVSYNNKSSEYAVVLLISNQNFNMRKILIYIRIQVIKIDMPILIIITQDKSAANTRM